MDHTDRANLLNNDCIKYLIRMGEDLQCQLCHQYLQDPYTTNCHHPFCKRCLEERLTSISQGNCPRRERECPTCQIPLEPNKFQPERFYTKLVENFKELVKTFQELHQVGDLFPLEQFTDEVREEDQHPVHQDTISKLVISKENLQTSRVDSLSSSKTLVNSGLVEFSSNSESSLSNHDFNEAPSDSYISKGPPTNSGDSSTLPNTSSLFKTFNPQPYQPTTLKLTPDPIPKEDICDPKDLAELLFPEGSSDDVHSDLTPTKSQLSEPHSRNHFTRLPRQNSHPPRASGIRRYRSKKLKVLSRDGSSHFLINDHDNSETKDCNRILDSSPSTSISSSPALKSSLLKSTISSSESILLNAATDDLLHRSKLESSDISYSSIEILRKDHSNSSINLQLIHNATILNDESFPGRLSLNSELSDRLELSQDLQLSGHGEDLLNISVRSESELSLFKNPNLIDMQGKENSSCFTTETPNLELSKSTLPSIPSNQLARFDTSWSQFELTQSIQLPSQNERSGFILSPTQALNNSYIPETQVFQDQQFNPTSLQCPVSPLKIRDRVEGTNKAILIPSRSNSDLASVASDTIKDGYCIDQKYMADNSSIGRLIGTPLSQLHDHNFKRPASFILDDELDDSGDMDPTYPLQSSSTEPDIGFKRNRSSIENHEGDLVGLIGTPFSTPVRVKMNPIPVISDNELEDDSQPITIDRVHGRSSDQEDSPPAPDDTYSSRSEEEAAPLLCGTPFSHSLHHDSNFIPRTIFDDELAESGTASSSLPRSSGS